MNERKSLATVMFYLITLISQYLLFPMLILGGSLFQDMTWEVIFMWPVYYVFPALATYGYNIFLMKSNQKTQVVKRILWVALISFNTLILIIPFAFPLRTAFSKPRK